MNVIIETITLRDKVGDEKGLEMIKQAGFDGVDFSYYLAPEDYAGYGDDYVEYAKKLRAKMDELSLKCLQAHAPLNFAYGGEFSLDNKWYKQIVRSIESASILGAPSIVIHVPYIAPDIKIDTIAYFKEYYKTFIPYLEKFKIKLAIENVFGMDFNTYKMFDVFTDARGFNDFVLSMGENFCACVDVGHAGLVTCPPEEYIKSLDYGLIKSVHLHDNDCVTDMHTLPFQASFNWDAIMSALKDNGYNGAIAFEVFNFLKKLPNELLDDALKFAYSTIAYLKKLFENQ